MKKSPPKVMLLDDDVHYLEFAYDLLAQAGFAVHAFSKPAEGWEELGKIKPDCFVLDLHMPLLDGREFLPWARKECPGMAIVICTGQSIVDSRLFKENGVKHILQKPVSSATLIRTLETAIHELKAV